MSSSSSSSLLDQASRRRVGEPHYSKLSSFVASRCLLFVLFCFSCYIYSLSPFFFHFINPLSFSADVADLSVIRPILEDREALGRGGNHDGVCVPNRASIGQPERDVSMDSPEIGEPNQDRSAVLARRSADLPVIRPILDDREALDRGGNHDGVCVPNLASVGQPESDVPMDSPEIGEPNQDRSAVLAQRSDVRTPFADATAPLRETYIPLQSDGASLHEFRGHTFVLAEPIRCLLSYLRTFENEIQKNYPVSHPFPILMFTRGCRQCH